MNRCISSLLCGCLLLCCGTSLVSAGAVRALAVASPCRTATDRKTHIIETTEGGRVSVEERQVQGHLYDTLVIRVNGHTSRVPDERVFFMDHDGKKAFYNDDEEDRYDHECHLSPDGTWLFVARKLFHKVGVAYLYHRVGARFLPVRIHGMRFDEAAITYFAERLKIPCPTVESGARVAYFQNWGPTDGSLIFRLDVSRHYNDRRAYQIISRYGLRSGRFKLISEEVID
jgi:hypothetical protein